VSDSTPELNQPRRPGLLAGLVVLAAAVLIIGFIGGTVFTTWNDRGALKVTGATGDTAAANTTHHSPSNAVPRPALTAEEETYAAALWPIHSEVKLAAVNMSFAGIAYKTGGLDSAGLKTRLEPLQAKFAAAAEQFRQLPAPASRSKEHGVYAEALQLYQQAITEMIKVTGDGRDEHLLTAQQQSQQASTRLLILSDALWPGEYKPN
jgi:hypothetical protein